MMTFSDLSTLLLTFFVLLISMSSLNEQVLRTAFHNFDRSSGILFFKTHEAINLPPNAAATDLIKTLKSVYVADIRDIDEKPIEEYTDEEINLLVSSGNLIWYKQNKIHQTFSFIFGNDILFEPGSAILKPSAFPFLDRLSEFLKSADYVVFISGHSDNLPPGHSSPYPDNDALSLARAMAVLEYFTTKGKVPPSKIAIGAYGDRVPIASNSTPEGRALNRRVELLFKPIKKL